MTFTPSVSIIIAVKNAKALLEETLNSIQASGYEHLEVIVIDGGSNDGTVELLKSSRIVKQYISEPDGGISDAFNKGLQLATGDYINFQGAGDLLIPNSLQKLFSDLDNSYQLICGKVMRVQMDGVTPIWVAPRQFGPFNFRSLLFKMSLPHQALFTHRSFFEKFGLFDTRVRFAMDYELLLRAYHQFPKTIVKDVLISCWREGGVGQNRIYEIFKEYHRIKSQHKVTNSLFLSIIDFFNKFKYVLKTKCLKRAY